MNFCRNTPINTLILFCCLFSFATSYMNLTFMGYSTHDWLHFPATVDSPQVWRWVTHIFLHFGLLHITFNLIIWYQLAPAIERHLGSRKLLQLVICSAISSGWCQYCVSGIYFGGLSGVIYCLFGYRWLVSGTTGHHLKLSTQFIRSMLIWLVIFCIQPWFPIANAAHISGLFSGVIFAGIDLLFSKTSPPPVKQ